eukprot:UN02515
MFQKKNLQSFFEDLIFTRLIELKFMSTNSY